MTDRSQADSDAYMALTERHDSASLYEAMRRLIVLANTAPDEVATVSEDGGWDGLCDYLGLVHDCLAALKDVYAVAQQEVLAADLLPFDTEGLPIPSGGRLVRRGGAERKNYDNARLVSAFAARIAEDIGAERPDGSEIVGVLDGNGERHSPREVISDVAARMAAFTGAAAPSFRNWRVGVAKSVGIDLAEFCDKTSAPVNVSVEGRDRIPVQVEAPEFVRTGPGEPS